MSKLIEKLRSEDWTTVWVSIPLLALALLAASFMPKVPNSLITAKAWGNIGLLFIITFVVLVAGLSIMGKQYKFKSLILSFVVVFAISILALVVSGVKEVKYYGFEAVFFSVVFGLIVRNFLKVPEWMKPAIQGEFFIKVGVVCLGATILIQEVMKSGIFGLIQAILVVSLVWFTAFFIAKALKVDERSAMILSSGVSICGVSACITAARVANGDDKKLSYIVSIVLIIVVPMIYLMPWLAKLILPQIFSDPTTIQEVSGAWIGGTIDTTSGVAASSTIAGEIANQQAVIIKAAQNVLIGVVAFFIALFALIKVVVAEVVEIVFIVHDYTSYSSSRSEISSFRSEICSSSCSFLDSHRSYRADKTSSGSRHSMSINCSSSSDSSSRNDSSFSTPVSNKSSSSSL